MRVILTKSRTAHVQVVLFEPGFYIVPCSVVLVLLVLMEYSLSLFLDPVSSLFSIVRFSLFFDFCLLQFHVATRSFPLLGRDR